MKTTKRTTVTVESFESKVIQLKRMPSQVFCTDCQKPISELPITKITFAQPVSETENMFLFITDSGTCFFFRNFVNGNYRFIGEAIDLAPSINPSNLEVIKNDNKSKNKCKKSLGKSYFYK